MSDKIRSSRVAPHSAAEAGGAGAGRAEVSRFGDAVRVRREELGLAQGELASHLGVSQQTVSRWEQGNAFPPPRRIPAVAEILHLDLDDLHRLAGYLPRDERSSAWEQFHAAFIRMGELSDDELLLLIDHAWDEYRRRRLPAPEEKRPR